MKEEEGTAGALVGVVAVTDAAALASFSPLNFPTYLTRPRVSLIGSVRLNPPRSSAPSVAPEWR